MSFFGLPSLILAFHAQCRGWSLGDTQVESNDVLAIALVLSLSNMLLVVACQAAFVRP